MCRALIQIMYYYQGLGPLLEFEGKTLLVVPKISRHHLSYDGENQKVISWLLTFKVMCPIMTLGSILTVKPSSDVCVNSWMPPEFP